MTPSLKKRFWKTVSVRESDAGFAVFLDQHQLMTPAKAALLVPTRALADAIAGEWRAQSEKVDPATMPMTRRANAAIDKVAPQHSEVADLLAAYGGTDLVCYRATHPVELIDRQAAIWDPVLDWAVAELGVELAVTSGVMHVDQRVDDLAKLHRMVHEMDAFKLAGFHDLVAVSGSLLIAFMVIRNARPIGDLWPVSRVDEDWQAELWGADDEAADTAKRKQAEFEAAHRFFGLVDTR